MSAEQRLELRKGDHVFVVRYDEGQESAVVSALADWAANDELDFDWADATLLTFELGLHGRSPRGDLANLER